MSSSTNNSPQPPAPATPLEDDDPFVTDCDAYAASETDPDRKGDGVAFEKISAAKAIPACQDALSDYPKSRRFQYQLGRAYEKQGDNEKAIAWYKKAADLGNVEAARSLKKLSQTVK